MDSKYSNWTKRCKQVFSDHHFEELIDIDVQSGNHMVSALQHTLQNDYIEHTWKVDLNRVNAKKGPGQNKLRTYRLFKQEYKTEAYVMNKNINKKERHALARIRCGIAPIRVELGRYDHGTYVPVEDRICEICRTAVEDEKHILLNCVYYNDLHIKLFKDASTINEHFSEMSEDDKFIFLMSNPNVCIFTAKTCKKILDRRKFYFRNF